MFLSVCTAGTCLAASLTPGNLAVYRVGDTSTNATSANAVPVYLDEYTQAGTLVQSIPLPTQENGSQLKLTAGGTASTEGFLNLSVDRSYLTLTGYDAPVNGAIGLSTRVIGRIDAAGNVDTSTRTSGYNSGLVRSAVSTNGQKIWIGGRTGGVRFNNFGDTTSTSVAMSTEVRVVEIYDGQLYVSAGPGTGTTGIRLATVGTGLPESGSQTVTNLSGITSTNLPSPYGFVLLDLSPMVAGVDTLYVADDSLGAVLKFSLVSGTWAQTGSVAVPSARGLTAVPLSSGGALLFATNAVSTTSSNLFRIVDGSGYNGTLTGTAVNIRTASSGTLFRGVDFTPGTATTSVGLDSFTATSGPGGTLLQWHTGWELDNLGFNVYREEGGLRAMLNPSLIAGSALLSRQGLLAGNSYAWTDPGGPASAYWLEDVDTSGETTLHGPFFPRRAAFRAALQMVTTRSPLLTEQGRASGEDAGVFTGTAPREEALRPSLLGRLSGINPAAGPSLKIGIRGEGWHHLSWEELNRAGLPPGVERKRLRLFTEGRETRLRVDGEGIAFYGMGLDTLHTDTRPYWLTWNEGQTASLPLAAPQSALGPAPASFPLTIERRERRVYFGGLLNGDASNFFGPVISRAAVEQEVAAPHRDPAAPAAVLEVRLQGVTSLPARPDHRVAVCLNGARVGEVVFDARERGVLAVRVPSTLLREGKNAVTLWAEGAELDVSLVESVRLTYARRHVPDGGSLRFTAYGGQAVTLRGFQAGVRVLDVTDPLRAVEVPVRPAGSDVFQVVTPRPPGAPRMLFAFSAAAVPQAAVTLNRPSRLLERGGGADLVILAPAAFHETLAPLVVRRQAQGLAVQVVDVEDVYDEASYGVRTPEAIRNFLAAARRLWARRPRYLLLAGDASLDPRNYQGAGDWDLVPTRLLDLSGMETASDDWFGDLDGDGAAEVAVGRLPARSAAELAALVAKIRAYELDPPGSEALFLADTDDRQDLAGFEAASSAAAAALGRPARQLFRGELGAEGARRALVEGLTRGASLVNYVGHGSVDRVRASLITNETATGLRHGRLPVWVAMTCLNGYFVDPRLDALGEALLKNPEGGAVAVWASAGTCAPEPQAVMNAAFYRSLRNGGRLGDAVGAAKRSVQDGDVRRTWILLGDPSLPLK